MLGLIALGGCAGGPDGPAVVTLSSAEYDAALVAAVDAARDYGLRISFQDERSGVIETEPGRAPSFLEPWDRSNRTFALAVENTLAYQRRRARFEFTPRAFREQGIAQDASTGPNLLAATSEPLDLTKFDGDLELRVWVYLERSHVPGIRRSTWTRRHTTRTEIIDPPPAEQESRRTTWTPVSRDPDLERELLAAVQTAVQDVAGSSAPSSAMPVPSENNASETGDSDGD